MSAQNLLTLVSAARDTGVDDGIVFDTSDTTYAAWDMTVTAITGGASTPSITFFLDRQGADGVWYQIATTSAITSPGTVSIDISPALNGSVSGPLTSTVQHNVFTRKGRLRWTFGGGTPPTSVTFSASIIGR
jgi:hypothetical protein